MGGLINYVLENNLFHQDYVANYTNAAFVCEQRLCFHDGLFSGYDKAKRAYDPATWSYEVDAEKKPYSTPPWPIPGVSFR